MINYLKDEKDNELYVGDNIVVMEYNYDETRMIYGMITSVIDNGDNKYPKVALLFNGKADSFIANQNIEIVKVKGFYNS